jgi:hypothetical protein
MVIRAPSFSEDALPVQRAAVQQHVREARVVHHRRGQALAAGFELDRFGGIGIREDPVLLVRVERLDEARHLAGRDLEGGVGHAERLADALLEELAERHAGNDLDQAPQHIGRAAVPPGGAGLEFQRQLADARHQVGVADVEVVDAASIHLLDRPAARNGLKNRT